MKLTALFVMLMAVLALFAGAGDAAPQPAKMNFGALKKAGRALTKVVKAVSAAATAHEVYKAFKDRKQ